MNNYNNIEYCIPTSNILYRDNNKFTTDLINIVSNTQISIEKILTTLEEKIKKSNNDVDIKFQYYQKLNDICIYILRSILNNIDKNLANIRSIRYLHLDNNFCESICAFIGENPDIENVKKFVSAFLTFVIEPYVKNITSWNEKYGNFLNQKLYSQNLENTICIKCDNSNIYDNKTIFHIMNVNGRDGEFLNNYLDTILHYLTFIDNLTKL